MIIRRKKQAPVQRLPHLNQQKQTTFRYSSNRSQTERILSRQDTHNAEKALIDKAEVARRAKRLPYLLIGFGLLVCAAYYSLLLATPQVVIKGDQAPVRDGAAYARLVSTVTDSPASHSKLTLNRKKITNELTAQFPELRTVTVTTPLFSSRALISLEVARPSLLLNNGSDTFLIDNRGVVLLNTAKEKAIVKTDMLPMVTDQSDTPIELGKQALTSAHVAYILELNHQSQAKKLDVISSNITSGAGELHVRYADLPYFVKYNLNENARKSFGTFYATKEHLERTKLKPAEYMDVRIPERAYVK